MINIKPFRDYSEHEVVNLFTLDISSGNKGSLVQMVSFDPDNHASWDNQLPGVPSYAYSADYSVNATVKLASSGTTSGILGLLLYDVREFLEPFHTPSTLANSTLLDEQQVSIPGTAIPILTRGIVEIAGFNGVPQAGAGAYISDTISGALKADLPGNVGQIGTWLSSSGVDGYAILKIHVL
jgi:hypothetical protein